MFTVLKEILIMICVLTLAVPLYAQDEVSHNKETEVTLKTKSQNSFLDFINKKAYAAAIDKNEERKILRKKWKELLGVDIFYPYFKAKKVETWVQKKSSVKFFKLKGRPKFSDDQIKYTFKLKF